MTRRLNMSQCKRFINRPKVNRKASLAEAGKLTLPDQKVALFQLFKIIKPLQKTTSCDPWLLTVVITACIRDVYTNLR